MNPPFLKLEPKDYFKDIDNEKDDEGFEETLDPKLLKKLQKMKVCI